MKHKKLSHCVLPVFLIAVMFITIIQYIPAQAKGCGKEKLEIRYSGDGYDVSFQVTSKFKTMFNAKVTIKNKSKAALDNWAVSFALPYEIKTVLNGAVKSEKDGMYIIRNTGIHRDIDAGKSVSFYITAKYESEELRFPSSFLLLTKHAVVII